MAEKCPLQSIPQPPKHLFGMLGNIPDIDITAKSTSYSRLAAQYGPIFKLDLVSKDLTILSSHELVNEVFDETRFEKLLGTLREVRHAAGDGLITALTHEPVSLPRRRKCNSGADRHRTGNSPTSSCWVHWDPWPFAGCFPRCWILYLN